MHVKSWTVERDLVNCGKQVYNSGLNPTQRNDHICIDLLYCALQTQSAFISFWWVS